MANAPICNTRYKAQGYNTKKKVPCGQRVRQVCGCLEKKIIKDCLAEKNTPLAYVPGVTPPIARPASSFGTQDGALGTAEDFAAGFCGFSDQNPYLKDGEVCEVMVITEGEYEGELATPAQVFQGELLAPASNADGSLSDTQFEVTTDANLAIGHAIQANVDGGGVYVNDAGECLPTGQTSSRVNIHFKSH